jgi:hypothetical protein
LLNSALAIAALVIISCINNSQENDTKASIPKIVWQDSIINLGNVKKDSSYPIEFNYTVHNNPNLVFKQAHGSCGCTIINLGDTSHLELDRAYSIKGLFKTHDLSGQVERSIYILTNGEPEFQLLKIKANVRPTE